MKIQKFLTALVAAAAVMVSCEKAPEGLQLPANVKTDLNFTLSITEVTYNSAQISVKHDGTTNDSWYGFLTEETDANVATLISKKIAELTADGGNIQGLETRTSKRVNLNDLEAATKYKYIVFAIAPNGILYGQMASIDIETAEGFLLQTVEDWTVAYESRDAATNQETYSVQFKKSNAARCHVGFIPKWLVETYEKEESIKNELDAYGGLRLQIGEQVFLFSILDYLVFEELYEYWGYYDEDDNYFNQETFSESTTFMLPRQSSGDYYAVAIGFSNGTPTFTYSVSEISIAKETPSADYQSWLGTWNIVGANNIPYTLTFEENDPNYSYYVAGWECGSSVHTNKCTEDCTEHILYTNFSEYKLEIPFYFNALTGSMNIKSLLIQASPSSDNQSYLYWGMYGYTEYQGQKTSILLDNELIAEAAKPVDSKSTLVGLPSTTYNMDSAGNITEVDFTYSSLGYVMYDDKTYTPQPWNLPLELPATLEKSAAQPASVMAESARNSFRKESAVKSFNSIKKADYSKLVKADLLRK